MVLGPKKYQTIVRNRNFDMKPKTDEALNTKFSWEERSLLICQTTFEILKFEKWPHPVSANTKMDSHVSVGFHEMTYPTTDTERKTI